MSDISAPEMGLSVIEPVAPGRLQGYLDRAIGFMTEQRVAAGAVLAVLALSLAGCNAPSDSNISLPASTVTTEAPARMSVAVKTEAVKPSVLEFRAGEQDELATAMGSEDISKAKLTVIDRYDSFGSEVVVLGLDGFKPSDTIQTEFKAAVGVGEALSRRQPNTSSVSLQLGTGGPQEVKYQLQSSGADPSQRNRHYVVFTESQQAVGKLFPENTPQGGYTRQTSKGISLSTLPADSATINRDAFIEGFRTATTIVLDKASQQSLDAGTTDQSNLRVVNVPNPTPAQRQQVLLSILAQREAQSWADARQSARKGATFDDYSKAAAATPKEIVAFAKTGATEYIPTKAEYIALGYPA